jgi:hypothetical protein
MRTPEPSERSRLAMSTDRIMAAAVQIVDTEGSHALTMRRLGPARAAVTRRPARHRGVAGLPALVEGGGAGYLDGLVPGAVWPG